MDEPVKYPTALKTAEVIADQLGMSEKRILELAAAGYMPHYKIDGVYKFQLQAVKNWVANNLMVKCDGRYMPDIIRVVIPSPKAPREGLPTALKNVPHLQQIPSLGYQPGVYFLCHGDAVVYVGQSVNPGVRIAAHANDRFNKKTFDRVFLLPVPESELNDVEAAFIHYLRPAQQGGIRRGEKPVAPNMSRHIMEILAGVGLRVRMAHPL